MKIVPAKGELHHITIIDPSKRFGEEGQAQKYSGTLEEMTEKVHEAQAKGMEIRQYYRSLETNGGEKIASQIIVTHIPPGHVQPFHTHNQIHEMTLVKEGEILAIDSEEFTEDQKWMLRAYGEPVYAGQMVIEGPGTRHTIMNDSNAYALLETVQTAKMDIDRFPKDWCR